MPHDVLVATGINKMQIDRLIVFSKSQAASGSTHIYHGHQHKTSQDTSTGRHAKDKAIQSSLQSLTETSDSMNTERMRDTGSAQIRSQELARTEASLRKAMQERQSIPEAGNALPDSSTSRKIPVSTQKILSNARKPAAVNRDLEAVSFGLGSQRNSYSELPLKELLAVDGSNLAAKNQVASKADLKGSGLAAGFTPTLGFMKVRQGVKRQRAPEVAALSVAEPSQASMLGRTLSKPSLSTRAGTMQR